MSGKKTALAVRFSEYGNPLEVFSLQQIPISDPLRGEARVRMLYAPINPSDINTLEGTYGALRPLPDTPGNEGIGMVESMGPETEGISIGSHVLVPSESWRERGIWRIEDLIPLPVLADPVQASMLRINAVSAFCLIGNFHSFSSGEWFAQNASNSGVGRWVIALARRRGISAIHLARRQEVVDELIGEGAEHVLLDDENVVKAVKEISGEAPFPLALNAVGGDSAIRLSRILSISGTLVTYGAMSKRAFSLSAGALIFKDIRYRGFWLHKILEKIPRAEKSAMFKELFGICNSGMVKIPIAEIFPLTQAKKAVQAAMLSARPGKILLRLSES